MQIIQCNSTPKDCHMISRSDRPPLATGVKLAALHEDAEASKNSNNGTKTTQHRQNGRQKQEEGKKGTEGQAAEILSQKLTSGFVIKCVCVCVSPKPFLSAGWSVLALSACLQYTGLFIHFQFKQQPLCSLANMIREQTNPCVDNQQVCRSY